MPVVGTLQRQARALSRLAGVVLHLAWGVWIIRLHFPKMSQAERDMRVHQWAVTMLRRLSIQLIVQGDAAAQGPLLLASNHISWLDIVVIHAARHCRFISKSDVKHWPLVGLLATGAGTLFIERESRRDAMRVVHHMAERLRAGDILAVFPEGTTGDGLEVLPFHANLLQAAISAQAPIQPLALHFCDRVTGKYSLAPCYIGDDTLVASIWRTLCAGNLQAQVRFGAPQTDDGRNRRAWAADLRTAIVDMRKQQFGAGK
jgi:1-acyl-sn-glycerol-3-phosphate acyltransferase